jgi:thioesterase domain-containing protein/acyl carrier protein
VGLPGELYIGGTGVARGYLGDPELTASRFLPDPCHQDAHARLYRTGDLVFTLPDGNFVYLGRIDRQLKIRGFRIDPEEVESVLSRMAAVRHCGVLARDGQLAAYIAWNPSVAIPTLEEVRRHMSRRLPGYMVPSEFLVVGDIPLTANGKIDRNALPARAERLRPSGACQPPATPTQRRVADLWQLILGVPQVSMHDDFFELGGDSVRAATLLTAMAREFGREISWSAFRHSPTVAQLAAAVESSGPSVTVYHPRGRRTPVIAISSAPDDAGAFRVLADQLGEDWPFIAIASPVEPQAHPMEELAARVCRVVRAVRPEGPYVLAGYCFGGLVAYESARQLRASGADVRAVMLMDTIRPAHPRFLGSSSSEWRRRLVRAGLLPPLRLAGACAEATVAAARSYRPDTIDVPVAQFRTRTFPMVWRLLGDPRLAWQDLCGDFRAIELPGLHGRAVFERHGTAIAREWKRLLEADAKEPEIEAAGIEGKS